APLVPWSESQRDWHRCLTSSMSQPPMHASFWVSTLRTRVRRCRRFSLKPSTPDECCSHFLKPWSVLSPGSKQVRSRSSSPMKHPEGEEAFAGVEAGGDGTTAKRQEVAVSPGL